MCKSVGGKLTYTLVSSGFGAAFHTYSPCICCPWWDVERHCRCQPPARCRRGTSAWGQRLVHTRGVVSPALTLPSFWFCSCCQLQLGGLPDSAACLPNPALPLCSLACSVSLFLGQMTHTIIARFIKEVQWLELTPRLCGEAYLLGIRAVGADRPVWWWSWHVAGAVGSRKRKNRTNMMPKGC